MSDDSAPPRPPVALGFCRCCARSVHTASFSNEAAYREYVTYGTCQVCQDLLPPNGCTVERDLSAPVLHGTVFGAALEGTAVREVVLLPFQYDPCYGRFEYEPGDIVRAGAALDPLDPFVELAAVRPGWAGRCERALTMDSLADPLLGCRMTHNHMVVAFDDAAAAAAERLNPDLRRPPLVDLSAAVCWADAFGAPPEALLRERGARGPVASLSPLRQSALVARLLELTAPAGPHEGRPVLEHVLFSLTPPDAGATREPGDAAH